MQRSASANIRSIDELLERDRQREEDGFPRKIDVGRLIKPGKSGKEKVVIVPTTVEEKFLPRHLLPHRGGKIHRRLRGRGRRRGDRRAARAGTG